MNFLFSSDSDNEADDDVEIPDKPQAIQTAPLPRLWDYSEETSDDDDSEANQTLIPRFSSIEEASKFFSKEQYFGWL